MNLKSSWNKFWFSPAPYFDLAFMRIVAVSVHLFYLIDSQFPGLDYVYSLPVSQYKPLYVLWAVLWPWGFSSPPPSEVVFGLYGVTVLLGFASLFGILTNLSMILFSIGSILLMAFVFSFGDYHHPEALMLLALLAISLGPCGKVLSIDSFLARRRSGALVSVPLLEASSPYAGWPIRLIQCLYPLIYISAAVAKLAYNHYSLDWANGYTLQYYFIQDSIRKDLPLALWASQFHYILWFGQIVVLAYQITYFLTVPYPKLRWIYLPVGFTFHMANYLILYAPFPQWIALLGVYIPWAVAFKMLASKQVQLKVAGSGA